VPGGRAARGEWWVGGRGGGGFDVRAAGRERTADAVSPGGLLVARRYLAASDQAAGEEYGDLPSHELLRRLGVLRPDGALTQAGGPVFCPAPRPVIGLSRVDGGGGDVLNAPGGVAGVALLGALGAVRGRPGA